VVVDPEDQTGATFTLIDEDHTIGNSLRYILLRDPEVSFCGYSIPHPSENKTNIRVQTTGVPAVQMLRNGLINITKICDHVNQTFDLAIETHRASFMDTTT